MFVAESSALLVIDGQNKVEVILDPGWQIVASLLTRSTNLETLEAQAGAVDPHLRYLTHSKDLISNFYNCSATDLTRTDIGLMVSLTSNCVSESHGERKHEQCTSSGL